VLARPTGFERADALKILIPIKGADNVGGRDVPERSFVRSTLGNQLAAKGLIKRLPGRGRRIEHYLTPAGAQTLAGGTSGGRGCLRILRSRTFGEGAVDPTRTASPHRDRGIRLALDMTSGAPPGSASLRAPGDFNPNGRVSAQSAPCWPSPTPRPLGGSPAGQ
jgi:hypothetical protein